MIRPYPRFGGFPRGPRGFFRPRLPFQPMRPRLPAGPLIRPFPVLFPFDVVQCGAAFPAVDEEDKTGELEELLNKRADELMPQEDQASSVTELATSVFESIDKIKTGNLCESVQIQDVVKVGSFVKDVMIRGTNTADVCVVLRTLPTREALQALASKLVDMVRADESSSTGVTITNVTQTDYGFSVSSADAHVRVMIGTVMENLRKLDPELHLDPRTMNQHIQAIKHAKWFEENASGDAGRTIRALVRIVKEMRRRFTGLSSLNPWVIEVLCWYVTTVNTPNNEPLGIAKSFMRFLSLLSAGLFLPGSAGIIDPCEPIQQRMHLTMSIDHQDQICYTAQTLLRVLSHGAYKQVLGFSGGPTVATEMSVWNGVVVTAGEKVYERPPVDPDSMVIE